MVFNKSLNVICWVTHSSLNPLHKGKVELLCILVRHDFTFSTDGIEKLWVKIESDVNSNMICGVVYLLQSSNLETFLNTLSSWVIGTTHQGRENCSIYGDFNINLLNFDKQPVTEDALGSFFLEPHILKQE